ncbi:molybdopterin-binding/glycosyltransferase family 2 protein [Emcibacter sp. SYSU 3D8]|uniref:molybdopterin-binding/glycosyltransferase family 2 protein n=1 Tax=Emcibacter sp. SYSU 3D8 TaxID=3133969 RepID=UPI0031FEB47A
MIYADMPVGQAEGAILAHGQFAGGRKLPKGHRITAADIAALDAAGIVSVSGFRLEPGDVGEDEAAAQVAAIATGEHIRQSAAFTGRCNLFAETDGVLVYDRERLDALNLLDEAVTIAALPPYEPVRKGQMLATVKIIPFAVEGAVLARSTGMLADGGLLRVAPYSGMKAGLVETIIPGGKNKPSDKLVKVTAERLQNVGASLVLSAQCSHHAGDVADHIGRQLEAGCDIVLVAGASATTDRRDVVPAGIVAAGGAVDHFGMPVDPGNLLLLGHVGAVPVVGMPGCARSPKVNGFDFVLQRLAAGLTVTPRDIMRMGAGGLLKEIGVRPLPRAQATGEPTRAGRAPRIAAIVLAAGMSSRMGGRNKLLREIGGAPMIRRTVDAVLASGASPITVVTGRDEAEIRAALSGLAVSFIHNPDFAAGMAGSLKAGIAAVTADADGAVVALGDMPFVTAHHIDRLIAAYDEDEGRTICVPTHDGKWGNPVLWSRRYFPEMLAITGDKGARELLHTYADKLCEVPMDDEGILRDFDTPEAFGKTD